MKKLFLLSALVPIVLLSSCDKIKTPIQSAGGTKVDSVKYVRKVLLEDYTGHQCGNCPPAAEAAEALLESNPGKVVVIAVHAGNTFASINGSYPTSYTTTAGNAWDATSGFGISSNGNPNGLVNRLAFDGGFILSYSKWAAAVSNTASPYIVGMTVTPTYNAASRNLNTSVKTKFKTAYPAGTTITLVLTEDSVIGAQKDYRREPDKVPNYVFMHMLRGDINGPWGTVLKESANENDSLTVSFNNFTVNSKFKDKNVSVVAFISNAATKEVLQVEAVKLIKP